MHSKLNTACKARLLGQHSNYVRDCYWSVVSHTAKKKGVLSFRALQQWEQVYDDVIWQQWANISNITISHHAQVHDVRYLCLIPLHWISGNECQQIGKHCSMQYILHVDHVEQCLLLSWFIAMAKRHSPWDLTIAGISWTILSTFVHFAVCSLLPTKSYAYFICSLRRPLPPLLQILITLVVLPSLKLAGVIEYPDVGWESIWKVRMHIRTPTHVRTCTHPHTTPTFKD